MAFSVLMATYRGENPVFLAECLSSLADQTLKPDEIVLVKDGQLTRALERVIAEYAHLPIVTFDYTGSDQLGGALALGVECCSNEIVARMDSDDIARPERFEKQLTQLSSGNVEVLGGQISEFDKERGDTVIHRRVPATINSRVISRRNPLNHMTVAYSRRAVLEVGNYLPLPGFEDWYLWLRMFRMGARIENLQDVLVDARVGNDFLGRRSGFDYASQEIAALVRFRRERLIGSLALAHSIAVRTPIRLLPRGAAKVVYRTLLRSDTKPEQS